MPNRQQRHSGSIPLIKEYIHRGAILVESSFLFTFVTFNSNKIISVSLSREIKNVRGRNYQNEPSDFTHEETEVKGLQP